MPMNIEILREELMRDEGLRLKPYLDSVGKLTIGVGRNLDDVGISTEEAMALLDGDLQRTAIAMDKAMPWWRDLDDVRQRVLINMAFNLGVRSLLQFHNTLAAVQEKRFADAASAMLESKWAKQVGRRAERLAEMMRGGV